MAQPTGFLLYPAGTPENAGKVPLRGNEKAKKAKTPLEQRGSRGVIVVTKSTTQHGQVHLQPLRAVQKGARP